MKILTAKKVAVFTAAIICAILWVALSAGHNAYAQSADVILPAREYEYYGLNSPLNAYCDDDVTAVTESNRLIVFYNGETRVLDGRTSLNQVKRYKSDSLIFSDNGSIYIYSLSTGEVTDAKDVIAAGIGGSYFDYNGTYLITAFSSAMQIYGATQSTVEGIQQLTPVAINSDSVFYVKGNKIYRTLLSDMLAEPETILSEVNPSAMIASDDYLYYIKEGAIRKVDLESKQDVALSTEPSPFDLGKILRPEGLSFKDENLLVTDSEGNCVQEFKVEGDILKFTGFAIAGGKTAYNRLNGIQLIKKFGNGLVVTDANKMTVLSLTDGFDGYKQEYFDNRFIDDAPDYFAAGKTAVVYSSDNVISVFRYGDETPHTLRTISTVKDAFYSGGKFYVLSNNGANTTIITVNEKDFLLSEKTVVGVTANAVFTDCADNLYFADDLYVYKNVKDEVLCDRQLTSQFSFDLAGNIFALKDGKIYRFDGEGFTAAFVSPYGDITAYALSFDGKDVLYSVEGSDFIYKTDTLGNADFGSCEKDGDFALDDNVPAELKIYTVKDGYPVYGVDYTDGAFVFNDFAEKREEYALIGEIAINSPYSSLDYYALATGSGVVLVPAAAAEEKDVVKTVSEKTVYVTTKVSAYILPVMTKTDIFTLKDGENEVLRLEKGVKITAEYYFTALGTEYLFGSVKAGGEDIAVYVPANFTTDKRYEDADTVNYTIEKIKPCTVYSDPELTDIIAEFTETTEVRLIKKHADSLYISFDTADGVKEGYVEAKYLVNEPNVTVRNVLAILALFTCICGTITYFVLRKKS